MEATNFTKKESKFIIGVSSALGLRQLGLMLVLPFISIYGKTLSGNSPALIGLAIGIYGLAQGCFQIPFGTLSDRFGRKPIVLMGLFQLIIGLLLAYFAKNIYLFIFARALQGSGAINAAALSWVGDNVEKSRSSKAMGVISAMMVAAIAAALIGGSLLQNLLTVPQIFLLCALLILIALLYIWVELSDDKEAQIIRRQNSLTHKLSYNKEIFFNGRLLDLYGMGFVLNILLMGMFFIIPQFLEKNIGPEGMWKVFIPATIAGFVAIKVADILSQQGKARFVRLISFCGILLGIICLFSQYSLIVSIGVIIFFAAFICLNAQLTSGVNLASDEQYRGAIQGVSNTLQFVGSFIGGTLTGALWGMNTFLALTFVLVICIAGIILSISNFMLEKRGDHNESN